MEGTMDMTSNIDNDTNTNNTAAELAPRKHHHEAMVPSLTKEEEQGSDTKNKKPRVARLAGGSEEANKPRRQKDTPALSCARCKSTNTKFCYYNNSNLNQPRYFCKSCRRYWTQGGTLRFIPTGGGCRRNKRASGSSSTSAASSTTVVTAEVESTLRTRLLLTATSTMSVSSQTGLLPHDMPSTIAPVGGRGGGLDLAMDGQQGFLPFAPPLPLSDDKAPKELALGGRDTTLTFARDNEQQGFLPFAMSLPLSDDQAPEELATGWSDTTPTFAMDEQQGFLPFSLPLSLFNDQALEELAPRWRDTTPAFLDMLTEGYFEINFPRHPTYGGGLAMSDGSNGMDISFLLPEIGMWAPETDPMVEGMDDDVVDELLWPSSELDNYINDDCGYAVGPGAGVEQQQAVGDQQQEEDNSKAKESSKKNDDDDNGGSSASNYWTNTNNNDGAEPQRGSVPLLVPATGGKSAAANPLASSGKCKCSKNPWSMQSNQRWRAATRGCAVHHSVLYSIMFGFFASWS